MVEKVFEWGKNNRLITGGVVWVLVLGVPAGIYYCLVRGVV
jgi:hypothetical protein